MRGIILPALPFIIPFRFIDTSLLPFRSIEITLLPFILPFRLIEVSLILLLEFRRILCCVVENWRLVFAWPFFFLPTPLKCEPCDIGNAINEVLLSGYQKSRVGNNAAL